MADLEAEATRLYGLPVEEFTAARDARVKELKADKELAKAVKALRKPTVAAWAVNLLVREREDLVRQVLSIGDSLREAQSSASGDALRELSKQRRQVVAAVVTTTRQLAADNGVRLADAAVDQVTATLQAALSDGKTDELIFFAFDLLFAEGRDYRRLPLRERKARLKELLEARRRKSSQIRYVEHFDLSRRAA